MIETLKGTLTIPNSEDEVTGVTLKLMRQSAIELAHVVASRNHGNVTLYFTSLSINTAYKDVFERGQVSHNTLQIAVSKPQPVHFRCDMTALINSSERKVIFGKKSSFVAGW